MLRGYQATYPDEEVHWPGPGHTVAVVIAICDELGRVFQVWDEANKVWHCPFRSTRIADRDLRALAVEALSMLDMEVNVESWIATPIDIKEITHGHTKVTFAMYLEDCVESPAGHGQTRSRWTPFDTMYDARLGAKLTERYPLRTSDE
jgi:hypothetical protein